jgi:hypothetical protein
MSHLRNKDQENLMDKKKHAYQGLIPLVLLAVLLAACSLPSPNNPATPVTQQTPESIFTSAVQTVIAQLTAAAGTPVPGQTMETGPSPTQVPATQTSAYPAPATPSVIQATATIVPTKTIQPSPTATKVKPKPTTKPSPTTASNDPKLSLGTPTFQDTFKNSNNWGLAADKHSDMFIKNGDLVMKAFIPDQFDSWALTWPKTVNFYIEMTASPQDCGGLDRYGLILRASRDASTGYLFGFSCDGHFSFRKWDGVKYTRDVDWTKSSVILKGADQTNRLGVKAEGDHFTLYANGVKLTDFHDASYSGGYFGVFVAAAETANFTADVSEIDYWELP